MENKIEEWKHIPGYKGLYEVSTYGNIKSLNYKGTGKEGLLKFSLTKEGYRKVDLYNNKKRKTFNIHQLVAIVFLDHEPMGNKLVVDHINNDKSNNRVENLQVTTTRVNSSKDRKGTSKYTGVCWLKSHNMWVSTIQIEGVYYNLGMFNNEYEAHLAYQEQLNDYNKNRFCSRKQKD